MTRFLKLVRHEDGKWKALPNETDDLAQVSFKERKCAPIDPDQLLKSLDSLLSPEGGIRSIEDVPRVAGITKKFSKKLVSRCVYCNVLQATQPDILAEYLEKGGWETINVWLQYAKSSSSSSFLVEMLNLCKLLPMTLERLKENNTAKVVKSLVKHENNDVKELSTELVTKWMSIIKVKKSDGPPVEKKKKKEKEKHKSDDKEKEDKNEKKTESKKPVESPKTSARIKGTKRPSSEKEIKKVEYYEDVKIDPEPLYPVSKKPKVDRPKTAKLYQKKFRATGLEEETPLPKKIAKKGSISTVDKTAVVAAAKNALKLNSVLPDRITEKKINPDSLMAIHESVNVNKGIKLIPAKPRPAVLQESASFIDAIISQPTIAIKRKKKAPPPAKVTNSPTSPTMTAPKFSFYKDTLEMNEEPKKEESEKENVSDGANEGSPKKEDATETDIKEEPMDTNEEGATTPPNNEEGSNQTTDIESTEEPMEEKGPVDPNHVRSILSHGRRKGRKKSVKWVADESIKEIFYFEMDETERVNVLKEQNFMDLKSIELKREREALEKAKRNAGDRMEETARWWATPILIDTPPALIEPGCYSQEKERERVRQQSTLQEIYFTKEMIPDSPHEPDLEIVATQEPKVIPIDEENVIGAISDFSNFVVPKAPTPDLPAIHIGQSIPNSSPNPMLNHQPMMENFVNPPVNHPDLLNQQNGPMSMAAPYDPAEPLVPNMPPSAMLGNPMQQPNVFGMTSPPMNEGLPLHGEWRGPNPMDMGQPDPFFRFPNNMMPPDGPHGPGMNMRPRMMNDMFRPPMIKGPRGMGPRPRNIHRVPCRHFLAGSCRFAMKCSFLHPGVNGPPL